MDVVTVSKPAYAAILATFAGAFMLIATACSEAQLPATQPELTYDRPIAYGASAHQVPPRSSQLNDVIQIDTATLETPLQPQSQATRVSTQEEPEIQPKVTVSATGVQDAEPDVAVIHLAVTKTEDTVEPARNHVAGIVRAVIQAARQAGVDRDDIATTGFYVQPQYDWISSNQFLVGYAVTHTMAVTITDLDQAGHTIDAITAATRNDAAFHSIQFAHADLTPLRSAARAKAVKNAHRIARELAEASNRSLGTIINISETSHHIPSGGHHASAYLESARHSSFPTEIFPGTSTTTVHATFTLQ